MGSHVICTQWWGGCTYNELSDTFAHRVPWEFQDLPDDMFGKIAAAMLSDDPCSRIGGVCRTSTALAAICRQDYFWRVACELKQYDREDRTTDREDRTTARTLY